MLRIIVDGADATGDLPVESIGYISYALIDSLEPVDGKLRVSKHGLARGNRLRIVGNGAHRIKETLYCRRCARIRVRNQIIDLLERGIVSSEVSCLALFQQDLGRQVLVVDSCHISYIDTFPDKPRAGLLGKPRRGFNLLPRISGCACIGDIVLSGRET